MFKIFLAYLFTLATVMPAFAQVNRTVDGGRFPNANHTKNYVLNYGAEKNVTLGITASTHTVARSTTTPISDDADFVLTASGAGSVYWSLATFDNSIKNQSCEFKGRFEGDGSLWTAVVRSGTDVVKSLPLTNVGADKPTPFSMNVPCGDKSTTYTVGFTTTGSAAQLTVDDIYFGLATNLGTVSQAQLIGRINWPVTANCIWQVTSTTYANFPADTDCGTPTTFGAASAPATKIPAIVLQNMPAGDYQFIVNGNFTNSTQGNVGDYSYYRISDGTNSTAGSVVFGAAANSTGSVNYSLRTTTNQSNVTLQFQALSNSTKTAQIFNADVATLDIAVYYFPSQSQQVVSQASQGWFVAANISGANPSLGTAAVTSYTEITNASLTMTPKSGSAPVGITCSSTNAAATPSTGATTCSAGSESIGVSFNPPEVGWYKACASFAHLMSINNGDFGSIFQMIETPTNAQTLTQEGGAKIQSSILSTASISPGNPLPNVCGLFYFSSTATKAVRLMYEQVVSGTVSASSITGDASATLGQRDVFITVEKLSSGQNNPFVIGSVQTNSSGVERIERVRVATQCTGSPCTISSQSGNWATSITRSGTGTYQLNIVSGIFSGIPTCTCNTAAGGANTCAVVNTSATLVELYTASGTTATDGQLSVLCMGPK